MKLKLGIFMVAMVAVMCVGVTVGAEGKEQYVGVDPTADHYHMFGDSAALDTFHNPMEGVTLTLDQRIRFVAGGENIISLDKTKAGNTNYWQYSRNRTRLGAKFNITEDIDINTRLVWEWWAFDKPGDSTADFREAIYDHMNVTVRNVFDEPLTMVVGRQDIILGQGWLVLDGTPTDGSRTIFFDAVRATYAVSDETKVDLVYIHNYDDSNQWLHPFGHEDERSSLTNGVDERGAILYVTDKSFEDAQVEYYYIYKEDKRSDHSKHTNGIGVDAEIHTVGAAYSHVLDENWSYRVEGAKQFGNKENSMGKNAELKGWGTNNRIKYAVNDDKNTVFHLDYEFLSGDKSTSDTSDEGFDPLWGEWPQYNRGGDLPAYVWTGEGSVGEVKNMHRVGVGHKFSPMDKVTMETMYNYFWADENNMPTTQPAGNGIPTYSEDGNSRGQMITEYIKYKCCDQLSAHILVDYFIPGSYYAGNSRDNAVFARLNIEYVF